MAKSWHIALQKNFAHVSSPAIPKDPLAPQRTANPPPVRALRAAENPRPLDRCKKAAEAHKKKAEAAAAAAAFHQELFKVRNQELFKVRSSLR